MDSNIVIIGAGATGMGVASKLAREEGNLLIHVFEYHNYISFGACAIPYYISNDFSDASLLNARTITDFKHESYKSKINFYLQTLVTKIDFDNNIVSYHHLEKPKLTKTLKYKYLVIATGASAKVFKPFPINNKYQNIFTVHNKEDAIKIKEFLVNSKKILIIGGSYIGLEMAESLLKLKKAVTIIEKQSRLLANVVDQEFSHLITQEITATAKGKVFLNCEIMALVLDSTKQLVIGLKLNQQPEIINCDAIILATGVSPNSKFLEQTNVKLANNGAIIIDQYGRVAKKNETQGTFFYNNVFSAGDCATVLNQSGGETQYIALATTANKLARIIAYNIINCQKLLAFPGTLAASILRINKLEIATCGRINIQKNHHQIVSVFVKANDIPRYFPTSKPLFLKIFYDKTSFVIKAAQMAGYNRATLRINALAVAIWNKMDIRDLVNIDLVYAPPFSTTADIIHLAARKIKEKSE